MDSRNQDTRNDSIQSCLRGESQMSCASTNQRERTPGDAPIEKASHDVAKFANFSGEEGREDRHERKEIVSKSIN